MALTIVLEADELGKINIERTAKGGASVQFFGGSFYAKEAPATVSSGIYEKVVFSAKLFGGNPSTDTILIAESSSNNPKSAKA